MERHKTLFLAFLVGLSLLLSYKLMFERPRVENFITEVDTTEIISYKRFYSVKPNRESLGEIPNREINELIVDSLEKSSPVRVSDELVSSELKEEGYLVISAFDLPLRLVFACFKQKMPKLAFESFDRCYITKSNKIYLSTDKGVFKFDAKHRLRVPDSLFHSYVEMDENFMPTKMVGVSAYVNVVNPVESYSSADRLEIAKGFLNKEVAEIVEDDSFLFSTNEESVRIYADGNIHYLSVEAKEKNKNNLFDSLLALRAFIKRAPINFSNYRIISMYENDKTTLFYLTDASLPYYSSKQIPIVVNVSSNKVTNFSYSSKFVKEMETIYTIADSDFYRQALKDGDDPILVYTDSESNVDKRAVITTIDTR